MNFRYGWLALVCFWLFAGVCFIEPRVLFVVLAVLCVGGVSLVVFFAAAVGGADPW